MLTKSDYLLFKQCPKAFWLKKNKPKQMENEKEKEKMDKGNDVTEIARNLFPNGVLIPYSYKLVEMVEKTKEALQKGITTIYEAAFLVDDVLVICDILHLGKNGWEIYEVKASAKSKERHFDDVAFQYYVVNEHIPVSSIFITHINSDYSRGDQLDVSLLFLSVEGTTYAKEQQDAIMRDIEEMRDLLAKKEEVSCPIGSYCNKYGKEDFECAAKAYCWKDVPDYSVFDIARIGKKAFTLYEQGIVEVKDVPDSAKLTPLQQFQVNSEKKAITLLDKENLQSFLQDFTYPLYFLDFETFQQGIPTHKGMHPYEQIPFQYSLHVLEKQKGNLSHYEFLAKENTDPRRALAEQLVRAIPMGVTTIAYNMGFEKMVLRNLAETFPDLHDHLLDIHDNMVDLMVPFQKKWYYTSAMKGSYSIKYVLPALFPNDPSLNYKNLNIQNGSMAMEIFAKLSQYPPQEIQQIRQDLLLYCGLDTYAMVRIFEFIEDVAEESQ